MDLSSYLDQAGVSQADFGRQLGVSQAAVSQWLRRVPAERVLSIERATGGQVSRHELRPDLYPIETLPAGESGHQPVDAPADPLPTGDEAGLEQVGGV